MEERGTSLKLQSAVHDVTRGDTPANTEGLEDEIALLCAHINAATYRLLRCIRVFDEEKIYSERGFTSTAHWLSWRVGIELGAAREKVRVARALKDLPKIGAALQSAEISYSKVRALTRVATADNEVELLDIAKIGTASHVEKLVRKYRCATRAESTASDEGRHRQRSLHTYFDDDGMWVVRGRLPPEVGAIVQKALNSALQSLRGSPTDAGDSAPTHHRTENDSSDGAVPESHPQKLADALGHVAGCALDHDIAAGGGTAGDRHQVVVHVDADSLMDAPSGVGADAPVAAPGLIDGGPDVSAETCRRIACDCSVVVLRVDDAGGVLDLGRRRRSVSTALRRALMARDGECRFPGCTHTMVDAHHIRHWADGGETCLSNMTLLCRHHHRLVHEGGFRTTGSGEALQFFAPGSSCALAATGDVPAVPDDAVAALACEHRRRGLRLTPESGLPTWQGETMDYEMAVGSLVRAEGVPDAPRLGVLAN